MEILGKTDRYGDASYLRSVVSQQEKNTTDVRTFPKIDIVAVSAPHFIRQVFPVECPIFADVNRRNVDPNKAGRVGLEKSTEKSYIHVQKIFLLQLNCGRMLPLVYGPQKILYLHVQGAEREPVDG